MPDAPRLPLAILPTPLVHLDRLAGAASAPGLRAKRDDLMGFGVAGNKTRPLEYLVGQALADGCDSVVGAGTPKSNFIAGLALATSVAGIGCELLVPQASGGADAVNVQLARAAGARVRWVPAPREELDALVEVRAGELRSGGARVLAVPRGGSTPVGCLGFVRAALELREQVGDEPLTVVIPVGSGGSVAGLIVGAALCGAPWIVVGVSVSRPLDEMRSHVAALARGCADWLGVDHPCPVELVDAVGDASDDARALADLALRTEGLMLDPVYGVPTLAVAVERARRGDRVLVWLTGGLPSAVVRAASLGSAS